MRRLLNPLQWNFGPRTTATLLTWAVLPLAVGFLAVWRSIITGASAAGLSHSQASTLAASMLWILIKFSIPVLIVCALAAIWFSLLVVRPLWRLRNAMDRIAGGDLSQGPVAISSQDEVGQITHSFNEMSASLRAIITELAATAAELDQAGQRLQHGAGETACAMEANGRQIDQVRSVAGELSGRAQGGSQATAELKTAAEQVARTAEAQAREVEGAATTVRQVTQAIEQVASSAMVVSDASLNTQNAAGEGAKAVEAVSGGMAQVRTRVFDAAEKLKALSDSLAHVDEILQLISEIAEQTDLLALNAAIEAARVGEHGRGFAVVAGEVRRLAERSRKAAEEIGGRVEEIRTGAAAVVTTMEAGTHEVNTGADLALRAGEALSRILRAVEETRHQIESISAASEEISAASEQVGSTTEQLSAIAEENAATAEQMLSHTENVLGMIAEVEDGARDSQCATGAMAAASVQVTNAVQEMLAAASQVAGTAATLHARVSRFKLS